MERDAQQGRGGAGDEQQLSKVVWIGVRCTYIERDLFREDEECLFWFLYKKIGPDGLVSPIPTLKLGTGPPATDYNFMELETGPTFLETGFEPGGSRFKWSFTHP